MSVADQQGTAEVPAARRGKRSGTRGGTQATTCADCGATIVKFKSEIRERNFCDHGCRQNWFRKHSVGVDAPHFKHGSVIKKGYIWVYAPWAPCATKDGYALLSRLIMEIVLDRPLAPEEEVHHKDGNKADCSPGNLEVKTGGEHTSEHWRMRDDG